MPSIVSLLRAGIVERQAAGVIETAREMNDRAIKKNADAFDDLVDMVVRNSAKGPITLRGLIEAQGRMAAKMESVQPAIEAQFEELAKDKLALEKSSAEFRARTLAVYQGAGPMATRTPRP